MNEVPVNDELPRIEAPLVDLSTDQYRIEKPDPDAGDWRAAPVKPDPQWATYGYWIGPILMGIAVTAWKVYFR